MRILYGKNSTYVDVTIAALRKCVVGGKLTIPAGDVARARIFGDPLVNVLKDVHLEQDDGEVLILDHSRAHSFDVSHITIPTLEKNWFDRTLTKPEDIIACIHRNIEFVGGNIRDELPEQMMTAQFIKPESKVLELGSNIGRNTLVIATILSDQKNLVTLECDPRSCTVLEKNRALNGYTFHIEGSALSYCKLIQKGWDTIPSDVVLPGYTPVESITFEELETKYNIQFDTMVVDAEGALYWILKDRPQILTNIKLMIMENDYYVLDHKIYVDMVMMEYGFKRIFVQAGGFGPCYNFFFEVWSR